MGLPPIGSDGLRDFFDENEDFGSWEPQWASRRELNDDLCRLAWETGPQMFVVFQELGERLEVRAAAWGLEFAERAVVVPTDGSAMYHLNSADNVGRFFAHEPAGNRPPVTTSVLRMRMPRPSACGSLQLTVTG